MKALLGFSFYNGFSLFGQSLLFHHGSKSFHTEPVLQYSFDSSVEISFLCPSFTFWQIVIYFLTQSIVPMTRLHFLLHNFSEVSAIKPLLPYLLYPYVSINIIFTHSYNHITCNSAYFSPLCVNIPLFSKTHQHSSLLATILSLCLQTSEICFPHLCFWPTSIIHV